jgi:outer membrane protein assembly factor BamB
MLRLSALGFCLLSVTVAVADDWPQFRGKNRDGISPEKGLLAKWPEGGPKLLWQNKDLGLGFSSVAVVKDTIYTLGTKGEDEVVFALDAKTGKELWSVKIGPIFTFKGNVWGDGPRGTPTLDGSLLFALGGQGDLVALDVTKKGAELWRKNLINDFDGKMMTEWGYSESPLVDGDQVLVTPGGKKGLMVALDKKTGKLIWQSTEVPHAAPYSSAVVANINDTKHYVQLSFDEATGGYVSGIDAKTGKKLWQEPIFKGSSYAVCPTPIVDGKMVYVTSGYGGGCHTFEVGPEFKTTELIKVKANQKKMKNTHGGVVLVDGKIYGHTENNRWMCQDMKTGKVVWDDGDTLQTGSGTVIAADGMLYLYTEGGEVGLAKATPEGEGLSLVSQFKLPELSKYPQSRQTSRSSKAWNPLAIGDGKLYVRDCEFLYCYAIK